MARQLPQPHRDDIDLVTVLQALADPVRLELIRTIAREGDPRPCSVDCYDVDVKAATLSHHWRVLREAGVTTTTVDGRRRWVTLRTDDLHTRFPGLLDAVTADPA
ncbi:MAG TPA: helix-turn-helix transcriptional regulator [Actinophytocola sp.]|uniref:ArsR/SmtB family transcription factor n=1 Tax=Actinophytocola sp. TaxID=1872138 RepID=UPI002DDC9A26|nr:helix-turn-helix transcriptional regulator [Actinophytocola sp.]HEV2780116.1 helix-turn-helix transcriptional regulator [Actinophytocola sp.]